MRTVHLTQFARLAVVSAAAGVIVILLGAMRRGVL